jgi:hypothetical protein
VNRAATAAAAVLLAAMAALLTWEAYSDSLTFDEGKYIRAGYCAVTRGVVDLEPSNPAGFKLLAGAGVAILGPRPPGRCEPGAYQPFYNVNPSQLRQLIFHARLPLVALTLLLAWAVYLWARSMLGTTAGLVALSLVAFEPNLLAHGHLATGDMLATFGTVLCLAGYWRARTATGRRWLVVSGVGLGLGLLGKASILFLAPALISIEVWYLLLSVQGDLSRVTSRDVRRRGVLLLTVLGVAWLLVCIAYLPFRMVATPTSWPAPLSWLVPPSWIVGVQYQLGHATAGSTHNYLNGQVRVGNGFWQYFLEAFALKTTLGMLALTAVALVITWRHSRREIALFLWLPALALLTAATLGGIDIGVRYILPIYPLVAIAIAAAVVVVARVRAQLVAVGLLLIAAMASSLQHAPGHIGYFNELAGGNPELLLADSNLDWGQDAWRLRDWWIAGGRPPLQTAYFGALPLSYYGIESRTISVRDPPEPGVVTVSLTEVMSYGDGETGTFALMRFCPTAIGRIGTSIQPLEVTGQLSACPVSAGSR